VIAAVRQTNGSVPVYGFRSFPSTRVENARTRSSPSLFALISSAAR